MLAGKIMNAALEPMAYTSISIKELQNGTTTDIKGNFNFQLEAGKYDLVVSMIGYKTQVITLTITKDYTLNIILQADNSQLLGDVQVIGNRKDRSEEIVRNVIRNKETHLNNAKTYSCNVYIKASDQTSFKVKPKKNIADTINAEQKILAAMNMAEVYLKADHSFPDKIEEERTAVKISDNR